MKPISLLPPQIKIRQREYRRRLFYLLAGAFTLFTFVLLNAVFFFLSAAVLNRLALVQQERYLVRQQIDALGEYAALHEQAVATARILEDALGKEPDRHALLLALALEAPTGIHISHLSDSFDGERGELLLLGFASDHDTISFWVERLEAIPQLAQVDCRLTVERLEHERTIIHFEISAVIEPGEPAGGRKGIVDL
ncbi:MAG TPA: hypothetical protein DCQ14_05780 [Firmicutes bacterium]|nr:hypothetical protein [Bacillota bacterium]